MDLPAFSALLAVLGNAGAAALLAALIVVIAVGAVKKWWVPGWVFEDSERRARVSAGEAKATADTNRELVSIISAAIRRPDIDAMRTAWSEHDGPRPQRRGTGSPAILDADDAG